jgi:hypothetical protein
MMARTVGSSLGRMVPRTLRRLAGPVDRAPRRVASAPTTDREQVSNALRIPPVRPMKRAMGESEHVNDGVHRGRAVRVDRHRIAPQPTEPPPAETVEPVEHVEQVETVEPAALVEPVEPVEIGEPAAPAPAAPTAPTAPAVPARKIRTFRPERAPARDKTKGAVRRPALLSERCLGCGAGTEGRSGMVTELVEVGPIRALRVIACSACPDRRRRGLAGL